METVCVTIRSDDFNPKFEGSFCVVEADDGNILLLHRQDTKPEGNTWGIPGGKMNPGETLEQTVRREVQEETGKEIGAIELLHTFYVKYPGYDFIFNMWRYRTDKQYEVVINPMEHKGYCWMKPNDAIRKLPLIGGLDKCFEKVY